jgi:hypothetical protein
MLERDERGARHVLGLELDQHVDVTIGAEVITQHRREQAATDACCALTECGSSTGIPASIRTVPSLEQSVRESSSSHERLGALHGAHGLKTTFHSNPAPKALTALGTNRIGESIYVQMNPSWMSCWWP